MIIQGEEGTTYAFLQHVGVFGEQSLIDDAPLVLGALEMRIRI